MMKTPRTDSAQWVETNQENALVLASFARELEIENIKLREALDKFRGQFDCYGCTGTAEETLDSLAKH